MLRKVMPWSVFLNLTTMLSQSLFLIVRSSIDLEVQACEI